MENFPLWLESHISTLSNLILTHRASVSSTLLSSKRTRLSKLIAALPESAATAHALCLNDLPVAAAALGLSSLSLACSHARNGELVKAVQAADRGIVMLGPANEVLDFIDGVEKCIPRSGMMTGMSEGLLGDGDTEVPVAMHLSGACATVAADDFPVETFRGYFKRDEPVLIRSCAPWTAVKSWRNVSHWERYGHRMVPVELEAEGGKMEEAFLPLRDVIRAMRSGRRVYMAQHALLSQIPSLCEEIETPRHAQVGGGVDVVNAWMGSTGTGSKLHHDSADNILVQVVGRKTVVLIPPGDPVYADIGSNLSPIDVEKPDYERFPRFAEARGTKVVLAPGDGLYIPAGYWHFVKARSSSISVNFWF